MQLRDQALERLKSFCENNLGQYAKNRNFDYGPERRDNISNLSRYITHRLIDEEEVIKSAHSKFAYLKIEKFIQEVFWRTYWKGWLELRPKVWSSYLNDLKNLQKQKEKCLNNLPKSIVNYFLS